MPNKKNTTAHDKKQAKKYSPSGKQKHKKNKTQKTQMNRNPDKKSWLAHR